MSEFFEAFNPAGRHAREQKDLDKVLVVQMKRGGTGPRPLDLDSGRIVLVRPGEAVAEAGPVVRLARPADLPRAGSVAVRSYLDASELSHTDPYLDVLRDAAGRAEQAVVLVAVEPDAKGREQVLGTVTWCPPGSPLHEVATDDEGEFRMLAVDPRAQGRGVGRLLVEAVLELARQAGLGAVVLSSADWMTSAHHLYRSLGFQRLPERDWRPREDIALQVFRRAL
ncbi:GNAT family N-acetyltransferase [Luteococcus peritonei]|uniref:GNAT family N-acetyltransferase n=1 Tax=Luteococcus peritonei TaxID=88874 RepID=A0ABW4RUP3_9ACTN